MPASLLRAGGSSQGMQRSATYRAVRDLSTALAAPLSAEDQQVQSMPLASPTKWHLAHTTWFFETFVLREFTADYRAFDPQYHFLFNSYYESLGGVFRVPTGA